MISLYNISKYCIQYLYSMYSHEAISLQCTVITRDLNKGQVTLGNKISRMRNSGVDIL